MRILQAIFLGMFVYGLVVGIYSAAGLSLMMFLFNIWAERKMAATDRAWANDPRNAKPIAPPASVAAEQNDCEYMRSKF